MNVCIYGGGNVAHALAATIGRWLPVTIITHHPIGWQPQLTYTQAGTRHKTSHPISATSDVGVAANADIVFIAVPQFAYEDALSALEGAIQPGSTVAFVPAPAKAKDYALRLGLHDINAVGFQRVPHISRIIKSGASVNISTDRTTHRIAVSNTAIKHDWTEYCARWFGGKTDFLSSFLVFTFNNSNPILHPSRMVVLFDNWRNRTYSTNPFFYAEWTDESSELYLAADDEMASMIAKIPEVDSHDYIPLRTHYGVNTPVELTAKLHSIPPFQPILSPMKQVSGSWVPDFTSRYFTEDVDCGLKSIMHVFEAEKIPSSTLSELSIRINQIRSYS